MANSYDLKYAASSYYWGKAPSKFCFRLLELLPPSRPLRLLDIGCGEGRNAVFFARNGYQVTAFDLAESGVEKAKRMAEEAGVRMDAFQADMLEYRLREPFDVVFCHGALHYAPPEMRASLFENYRRHTNVGGLNMMSAFVKKPFIEKAPDAEATAHHFVSGELFTHYQDWFIEFCAETVFEHASGGVPHRHAMDLIIARRME